MMYKHIRNAQVRKFVQRLELATFPGSPMIEILTQSSKRTRLSVKFSGVLGKHLIYCLHEAGKDLRIFYTIRSVNPDVQTDHTLMLIEILPI